MQPTYFRKDKQIAAEAAAAIAHAWNQKNRPQGPILINMFTSLQVLYIRWTGHGKYQGLSYNLYSENPGGTQISYPISPLADPQKEAY